MIAWSEVLVSELAKRRAILYLGSGTSAAAIGKDGKTPPTWKQFLEIGLAKIPKNKIHIKNAIKRYDYLSACEWIKERLDEDWARLLEAEFLTPHYAASPLQKALFQLDVRYVLTTNIDDVFDRHAITVGSGTVNVRTHTDHDITNMFHSASRTILKAHGTISTPTDVIFTREQYARARVHYDSFYRILDALLLTHTFIFFGCGLNDPDITLLLEQYRFRYGMSNPHYIVLPSGLKDDELRSIRANMNLKAILYDAVDNHRMLTESVRELVTLVSAERDSIALKQDW